MPQQQDMTEDKNTQHPFSVPVPSSIPCSKTLLLQDQLPAEDAMYLDKSPEFWAGWALAFYQWYSSRSFMEILKVVPLSGILDMYPLCHEMDIMQFADRMDRMIKDAYPDTRLKTMHINCGFSQSQLAADSGVALRQIQLFEQRHRDINNAAAITLLRLSRSLHCHMEDLVEY